MQKLFTIKPIISVALLLLLIFSSTPTQYLHKIFAHHSHAKAIKKIHVKEATASKAFATCQCDNTFTSVTYLSTALPQYTFATLQFGYFNSSFISSISTTFFTQKSLRAPPSLA